MKRLLFFLFCAVTMSANAQSVIKAYGDKPKARDIIQGVVKDSIGPLIAIVAEKNSKGDQVEWVFTDRNGHFSFKLVNPADSIEIRNYGYYSVQSPIYNNHYDVFLQKNPAIYTEEQSRDTTVRLRSSYKPDLIHPLLILDGHIMESWYEAVNWDGIEYTKDTFNEEEIAHILGIPANSIKKIKVQKGKEAIREWGQRAKNGVIEVESKGKEYYSSFPYPFFHEE